MNLNFLHNTERSAEVIRDKRRMGAAYGLVCGLAFALAAWGWDAYLLSQTHAYFPWLNIGIAAGVCALAGAAAGWMTAYAEKSALGAIFWTLPIFLFAWLVFALPFNVFPWVVSRALPQAGELLNYSAEISLMAKFKITLLLFAPFAALNGILQLPLNESAVFSTSIFGKIAPFVLGIFLMFINGSIADSMVNAHFREAMYSLDSTIQFALDQKDNPNLDKQRARAMHIGALNPVKEYIADSRHLLIGGYNKTLDEVIILVKFDETWVTCKVFYSQPLLCNLIP